MFTTRKKLTLTTILLLLIGITLGGCSGSSSSAGKSGGLVTPTNGKIEIPVASVSDGNAYHYQVKSQDGTMVTFFVLKSADGILRAAIDACDVCYRSGLGYYKEGDYIKGGCNPAPLNRAVVGDKLVINMRDINANSWYMKYRQS